MKTPETSKDLVERALAHHRGGRAKEAESLYRKVISRNPEHEQALFMLSVLYLEVGRFEEASRYLERVVAKRPHEPVFLTNLGEAYRRQGKLDEAASAFQRILEEDPDFPEAQQNLGVTLLDAGEPARALPHLERAVELRPDDPRFRVTLAWVLLRLRRVDESALQARRALELAPNFAPAHHHLGNALVEEGDRSGAIAHYRKAVELDPSDSDAHSNAILMMLTDPSYGAAELFTEASAWSKLHAEPLREMWRPHANERSPERRLRVGYVSPDFRAHPMRQFLVPLLEHHDASVVEVYLYSSVERPDAVTEAYRTLAGRRFRELRLLHDRDAAELVRRDGIDVLVDLCLHGAGRRLRLFARKPAPVQMSFLGYAGTTGLDAIDYRITDPHVDPPETDLGVYSEESLRLPETSWCYDALEPDLPVQPLPASAAGFVTFGCLNGYRKVHAGVLVLFARVLSALPRSRLVLYADESVRKGMRRTLEGAGVSAERVEFVGRALHREYLERYHHIDIGLDTFPFAGGTTTLDAAWMGVPVVTLAGSAAHQRGGVCIAQNLGLSELVASSEDDFVAEAVRLASDLERLSRLRAELRSKLQTSPLGDATRFARNLEAAYRTAWRRYCGAER